VDQDGNPKTWTPSEVRKAIDFVNAETFSSPTETDPVNGVKGLI
jgi:hypothetical protein